MDFKTDRPIFKQIVDICHERIIAGEWKPGERVPSVRELGVELSVNSHTALKAYELMEAEGVITSRRGLGFFLSDDARRQVLKARRAEFFADTLPMIFDTMRSLGISIDEVIAAYVS